MNYYFVWCPIYRIKVILADVETWLKKIIRDIVEQNNPKIIAL
jgi:REP element-mobilizing transposase RayT